MDSGSNGLSVVHGTSSASADATVTIPRPIAFGSAVDVTAPTASRCDVEGQSQFHAAECGDAVPGQLAGDAAAGLEVGEFAAGPRPPQSMLSGCVERRAEIGRPHTRLVHTRRVLGTPERMAAGGQRSDTVPRTRPTMKFGSSGM